MLSLVFLYNTEGMSTCTQLVTHRHTDTSLCLQNENPPLNGAFLITILNHRWSQTAKPLKMSYQRFITFAVTERRTALGTAGPEILQLCICHLRCQTSFWGDTEWQFLQHNPRCQVKEQVSRVKGIHRMVRQMEQFVIGRRCILEWMLIQGEQQCLTDFNKLSFLLQLWTLSESAWTLTLEVESMCTYRCIFVMWIVCE